MNPFHAHLCKSIRRLVVILYLVLTLGCVLDAFLLPTRALAASEPRFLILHLDGIPSSLLSRELDAGRLPNLQRAFEGGGRIEKALSLFPGGTEMIYPRLKTNTDSSQGLPVGWQAYDRSRQRVIDRPETLLKMASYLPRTARYQLLEGFGRGDFTAALAMRNIPTLLKQSPIVEFFWFPSDGAGHMVGEDAMRKSLANFDRAFGAVWPRLDHESLNLILYSDHGMAFSREVIDINKVVAAALGSKVRFYGYPHVYLDDPDERAQAAAQLVLRPEIDMAFYRLDDDKVVGVYKGGKMVFVENPQGIRYEWTGEGGDPLGYAALGYQGSPLSDEEWLSLTADSAMPAVPPSLTRLLHNPYAGDVVLVLNPPHRDKAVLCPAAGHMGLTAEDLMVSVLYNGPDLGALKGRRTIWLNALYGSVPALRFDAAQPAREGSSLHVDASELSLTLSPAYRWRGTLTLLDDESVDGRAYAEYELLGTYLFRLWAGVGVQPGATDGLDGIATMSLEFLFDRASVVCSRIMAPGDLGESDYRLKYRLSDNLGVEWSTKHHLGVSISW